MHTSSRFFDVQADVLRMMAFLSAARVDGSQPGYWHVGDLIWRLYQTVVIAGDLLLRGEVLELSKSQSNIPLA